MRGEHTYSSSTYVMSVFVVDIVTSSMLFFREREVDG